MNFFTEIREGLSISWGAIRANKMRSALTTLGIVIGIVTVTLMGTAIQGLNGSFLKSISSIGADVLFVDRMSWFINTPQQWFAENKRPVMTLAMADELAKQHGDQPRQQNQCGRREWRPFREKFTVQRRVDDV